jgi:ketosteroid isomerase-like protein
VLDAQVVAWNRGDIDGFMEGYDRSPSTRFASGGTVTRGWDTVMERYKANYATAEKMGKLEFTDLEITVVSPTRALAFGRWKLTRATDSPNGLFTLLFEKTKAGWRIVADHTSSAE